ncbi:MAG: DUF4388 domain-containing protein [Acidimicrobiales bacterium]
MALQGTLDTFALPDVLRLLASTRKTGRLRITANRGSGSIWLDGGSVVAANASSAKTSEPLPLVVFELLRHHEGSFIFEPEVTTADAGAPVEIDGILRDAERLLAEWLEIEAVVPSLEAFVTLSPTLPRAEMVVDAERWKVVVAAGGGATVRQLGAALALSEIEVSRAVKDVVEAGLLRIQPAVVGAVAPPAPTFEAPPPNVAPAPSAPPVAPRSAPAPAEDERAVFARIGEPVGPMPAGPMPAEEPIVDVSTGATGAVSTGAPLGIEIPGSPATWQPQTGKDTEDDDDLLRALGNLTPQAARAIAAAAQATTDAERDAALDQAIAANHEPLDRGLLMRFLSSVKQ